MPGPVFCFRRASSVPAIPQQDLAAAKIRAVSEADHRKMMATFKIDNIRRDTIAENYTTNPYPDPSDPLIIENGKKVKTAAGWWDKRRPVIIEDFDREIYGRDPKATPPLEWAVTTTTNETDGDVPVTKKRLVGHVDNSSSLM